MGLQGPAKDPHKEMGGGRKVRTQNLPYRKRERYQYSTPHSPFKRIKNITYTMLVLICVKVLENAFKCVRIYIIYMCVDKKLDSRTLD